MFLLQIDILRILVPGCFKGSKLVPGPMWASNKIFFLSLSFLNIKFSSSLWFGIWFFLAPLVSEHAS